jgi:tetratricopeptide (TPR) repeat protein
VDEVGRRAAAWVERAPSATAYRSLATALELAGRLDEAVNAARRAVALDGTGHSHYALADALLLAGRYAEVEELARPLAATGRSQLERVVGSGSLALALAYQGRRDEAVRLVGSNPSHMEHGSPRVAQIELLAGDPAPPPALAREVRTLTAGWAPAKRPWAAAVLALLGDREGALRDPEALEIGRYRTFVEAALAWREGDVSRALEPLRAAAREGIGTEDAPLWWLLAEAELATGHPAEAIAAADRLHTQGSGMWRTWAWPRALYVKAVALERLNRRDEAAKTVAGLLADWKRADPGLPLLADARALEMQLRNAP